MKKDYERVLQTGTIPECRSMINEMVQNESRHDTIATLLRAESLEWLFYGIQQYKGRWVLEDVDSLVSILNEMKHPIMDGELIAAYRRIRSDVAQVLEELTGVNRTNAEVIDPEKLDEFTSKLRAWVSNPS